MGNLVTLGANRGINRLPENDCRLVNLERLVLGQGGGFDGNTRGRETAAVVLSGRCKIEADGEVLLAGDRSSVFSGKPHTVYLPPGVGYRVSAESDLEIALCSAPASRGGGARLISPGEVEEGVWGAANFATKYHMVLGPEPAPSPAERLVLGETITPSGNWSTYPPHRHDRDDPPRETWQEEIYFFRVTPQDGFGFFRVYDGADEDHYYTIRNDTAIAVPRGFHTMASAPGCEVYSLWVVAGESRSIALTLDPGIGSAANT